MGCEEVNTLDYLAILTIPTENFDFELHEIQKSKFSLLAFFRAFQQNQNMAHF